jgi:regulatory protein
LTGSHDKARQYALKLLSYRGRSERELEERLRKKGFTKSTASSAIKYLKDIGLIDDLSLAETLKRQALGMKLLGREGARRYMLNRGIPREVIDRVFCDEEDMDLENAGSLVDRKLGTLRNYPTDTIRRRLYNFLSRRGYSSETISKALKDRNLKQEE